MVHSFLKIQVIAGAGATARARAGAGAGAGATARAAPFFTAPAPQHCPSSPTSSSATTPLSTETIAILQTMYFLTWLLSEIVN